MRTTPTTRRLRTLALAATTASLALALTACGGSDTGSGKSDKAGKADTGKAADAQPGADQDTSQDAVKAAAPAKAAGSTTGGSGAAPGAAKGSAAQAATTPCKGDEMSYHVLHRFPKQQGEHLLISARNADAKPCWVTSYPSVMLGDTSAVLGHSTKDAPGGSARITVKPGATVYAAVNLFTDGSTSRTGGSLSLAMRDQSGDTGPATEQDAFDAKDVPTKFTWATADVTHWNTAKPYDF